MAQCTELLYRKTATCGCWVKVRTFTNPSKITVSLFRNRNQCLLGISGQTNGAAQFNESPMNYVRKHDPVLAETLCGIATVRGFVMQAKKLFADYGWADFSHTLASGDCQDGVTFLGTSWGGAIAEIFAGCANQGRLEELQGVGLPSFTVAQLFTFGAPPTALMPIYNHLAGSGDCFRGQRVFLASETDAGPTDLVAYSTGFNAFVHARQDAVQLVKLPNGLFDVKVHRCLSAGSVLEPSWDVVFPVLAKIWNEHSDAPIKALGKYVQETHQIFVYVKSLQNLAYPAILRDQVSQLAASTEVNASMADLIRKDLAPAAKQGVRVMAAKASEAVANAV